MRIRSFETVKRRCNAQFITLILASAGVLASGQNAKLLGPVTFGSPDQPFGIRRPITAADRAAIQSYRSGKKAPVFTAKFDTLADVEADWTLQTDDSASLKSCRRPANVQPSDAGLRLLTQVATDCHNHWSTASLDTKEKYKYGFFEASMKIADITGINNAIWLTTDDKYEIDIAEAQYPNYAHIALQSWPANRAEHAGVGFAAKFSENLSSGFHDYGVLWTATDMIFEVDGEPVAALTTKGSVSGPATVRISTAVADFAGKVPDHPEGHGAVVKSLRIFGL